MNKRLGSYLRLARLKSGFTEGEIAYLTGRTSGSIISRLEAQQRHPSLAEGFGFEILFGSDAYELFPALFNTVEEEIMRRAYELYEQLQGDPSKKTRDKLATLENAFHRWKERNKIRQA